MIFTKHWEPSTTDIEWSLLRNFFSFSYAYITQCLDVRSERIDFIVSYVMVKTIQRLGNLKRGHATACLQWEILDPLYKFIKEDMEGPGFLYDIKSLLLLFVFWYSLLEILATQYLIQSSKWSSLQHFLSNGLCRMVVASKLSLKQCLNFWTCHLVFIPSKCMVILPAFVL